MDEWYRVYKKPSLVKSTLYTIDVAIRVYIKPYLMDLPLDKVQGIDLQKFLTSIEKTRTRETVYQTLNASFTVAKQLKYVEDNPLNGVKLPKHKRKHYPAIQPKEQNMLLSVIDNKKYLALFWYCCCTGMRISEAISSLPYIDFKNNIIHVQGEDTQTKKHKRIIEFLPELLTFERLRLLKEVTVGSAQNYFKRLFKKHKLDFVIHSFRHTFASCCHHVKISDKWTQTRLGHSSIEMTMDVYVDLMDNVNSPIIEYFKQLKKVYNL